MAEHWQSLVANLAVVALFMSAWVHGQFIFAGRPPIWRKIAFGIAMGLGAVVSMLLAIPIDGAIFDLRLSLVALASFFGGPISGAIAAVIAIAYRTWFVGGAATLVADVGIGAVALLGLAISRGLKRRLPAPVNAVLLAIGVAGILPAVSAALPASTGIAAVSVPVALMNAAATLVSAFFMMRHRVLEAEHALLNEAFLRSPDLQYVKTVEGKFAAVNENVASYHGFADPAEMLGKSDFDIDTRGHAGALMAAEQALMRNGQPISDLEEMSIGKNGEETWFLTSKVPLHDTEGRVIGLAGVTRDVTAQRRMRDQVEESRRQLDYVLAEMSDGIAMFDRGGVLVYCNERYREFFALTRDVRQPGRHISEILRAVAAAGEQVGIARGSEERWVAEVEANLHTTGEQEVQLKDGRWLHVRTRPAAAGDALVVVSDVTKLKQTEEALLAMTEQLKLLATTDSLTGLANRRAFDLAIDDEIARGRRSNQALTLLMVDVDRFKSYNDMYGHQAGDDVLKSVADCFRRALRRPGDIAARYGGEEFVGILSDTDEDAGLFIADAFREGLRSLNIPHQGADGGLLTVSIGIATIVPQDEGIDATELLRRADEALYIAKDRGRDQIASWRPEIEIRPRRGRRA